MSAEDTRPSVEANLGAAPVIGVVRTDSYDRAEEIAHTFLAGGLRMIEITFSVAGATELVAALKDSEAYEGISVGMGTVTTAQRARQAIAVGADFIVSPNTSRNVATEARQAGRFLVLGALSCTEIVEADQLGADLIKVYPLPPVGGPAYLNVIRQPLSDIRMLAAGGFGVEEIPAYKAAGAVAFGIGPQLLGNDQAESLTLIGRALTLALSSA